LLHRRDKPTITNLKSWLAILFGLNVEYITFTEKINTAEVEIFVPYPQALGVFNQLGWKLYLEHFMDKFRPSGITFKYTDIVFTKSENASGKWSEGYAQAVIT